MESKQNVKMRLTAAEAEQLRSALCALCGLSDRLRRAAEAI